MNDHRTCHSFVLPFYNALTRFIGLDGARRALLEQAALAPGQRVLDVGCGPGPFAVLIERLYPEVAYVGLDPDPKALKRARRKAPSATFDEGSAQQLPYGDASFDRVFSSFMFHHLGPDEKPVALREMRRVLKPGGSLHLVDFGGPESAARGLRARIIGAHGSTRDNFGVGIPRLMNAAGFRDSRRAGHGMVLVGPIAWYRGDA